MNATERMMKKCTEIKITSTIGDPEKEKRCTYRLLVPPPDEEEEVAVDEQERVHDAEEVVRVPEGVEAGEPVERRREPRRHGVATGAALLGLALAERVRGEREGDGHEHHHGDARDALGARQEPRVRGLVRAERAGHQRVLLGARRDHPREVARQVVPRVQRDPHHDRRRDHLTTRGGGKRKKSQQHSILVILQLIQFLGKFRNRYNELRQ